VDYRINLKQLRQLCVADEQELHARYKAQRVATTSGQPYLYFDNGAHILAVAHLDTVRQDTHFIPVQTRSYSLVYNARLDDRLGVYLLMHKLPELLGKGAFDVLLTTNEETLQSTGFWFEPPAGKQYNWLFEFDRRGDDVVMYDYETPELRKLLTEHGFKPGTGSYSDISDMDALGVSGFNFGCGYYDAHQELCYADIHLLERQLKKFVSFYGALHNRELPHTPKTRVQALRLPYVFDAIEECIGCGALAELDGHKLCDTCAGYAVHASCDYCTTEGATYYGQWDAYLCTICAAQLLGANS